MGKAKDITGQRFGRLVAIRRTGTTSSGLAIWEFQCDCGKIIEKTGRDVWRGQAQSCGCLRKDLVREKNLKNSQAIRVGDRFGELTVIELLGLRKQASRDRNESWSKCQCSCGNIIEVRDNNLKTGMTRSCGCVSSRGEKAISQILNHYNINFVTQYTFPDLKGDSSYLRFDFAIFYNNKLYELIEFDGRQHFVGPDGAWNQASSLEKIQQYDNLKNTYCKEHNIKLIRIPYWQIDKIDLELLGLLNIVTGVDDNDSV